MLARNLKIHPSIRKSLSLVHVLRYFSSAYILTVSFSTIYCSSILLSHNSEQPQYVSIIVQQDATLYSLFTSANCSTCFGWYIHRSSGAHIIVSTVSGIIETVTATYREPDTHDSQQQTRQPPTQSKKYQCRIDTVSSPDDGHAVTRNM